MTIEQTVEIPRPEDAREPVSVSPQETQRGVGPLNAAVTVNATGRRLTIDVPREIPAGPVILTLTPKPHVPQQRTQEGAKSATPHADHLLGILAGAGDITLEQIREERLVNKYLK